MRTAKGKTASSGGQAFDWLKLADATTIDWQDVAANLPFAVEMEASTQDPIYHAEGDVWTHTRLVVEALLAGSSRSELVPERWRGLVLAALLHDIAKPVTRREETDVQGLTRIRNPGHAKLGAQKAWIFLWQTGLPRPVREQVHHIVAWHQRPFHLVHHRDWQDRAIAFSQIGVWRELLAHVRADIAGRISRESDDVTRRVDELGDRLAGLGILDRPWPFPSDAARVWQGRKSGRSPYFDPPEPKGSRVIVLSGLPGAGKDTYCQRCFGDWPQISLDRWREKLRIKVGDEQGPVVEHAIAEAREHLRAKRPFVWNATNVFKPHRDRAIGLCLDYDAFVEIHAFDMPPDRLFAQNRNREQPVPDAAMQRFITRWEPPSVLEAHRLVWVEG
ncbi:MAG: AAA family ATPase [Hyphomicrobiaceae bacterium]